MNNRSSSSPTLRDGVAVFQIIRAPSWARLQLGHRFASRMTTQKKNLRRNTVTTLSTEWSIFQCRLSREFKASNSKGQDARRIRSPDRKLLPTGNGKHSFRTTTSSFALKARPKGLR